MSNNLQPKLTATSPLHPLYGDNGRAEYRSETIALNEIPFQGMVRVQGHGDNADFQAAVKSASGLDLPEACSSTQEGDKRLLWLTPNEWVFVLPADTEWEFADSLRASLAEFPHAVTIMSDSRVTIEVSGENGRTLLSKSCGIDMHPNSLKEGTCLATRFANMAVMILVKANDTFELYADRGLAVYLWNWLMDSAEEFAC